MAKTIAICIILSLIVFNMAGCRIVPTDSDKSGDGVSTVTDIDGNVYNVVKIGNQTWMAENLKVTKLQDSTPIFEVTDSADWNQASAPAYCWYQNDEENYGLTYGALYNGIAVQTGKLAPEGWRVATEDDWFELIQYLGGAEVAGGKLKEDGNEHWEISTVEGTDNYGFSALPGGYRHYQGSRFFYAGKYGYWWSSTAYDANNTYFFYLEYHSSSVHSVEHNNKVGYSVRCIKE